MLKLCIIYYMYNSPDPSVVVSVSPNKLNQSGDWVTVQWEGVSDPSSDDWIGVYAPPHGESVNPSKIAPVKFQVLNYIILDLSCMLPLSAFFFVSPSLSIVRSLLLTCLLVKVLSIFVLSM